jgi:hypothetical protein
VKIERFELQPLPPGFSGKLKIDGTALWLEMAARK